MGRRYRHRTRFGDVTIDELVGCTSVERDGGEYFTAVSTRMSRWTELVAEVITVRVKVRYDVIGLIL